LPRWLVEVIPWNLRLPASFDLYPGYCIWRSFSAPSRHHYGARSIAQAQSLHVGSCRPAGLACVHSHFRRLFLGGACDAMCSRWCGNMFCIRGCVFCVQVFIQSLGSTRKAFASSRSKHLANYSPTFFLTSLHANGLHAKGRFSIRMIGYTTAPTMTRPPDIQQARWRSSRAS